MLTTKQLADVLHLSIYTILRDIKSGKIPAQYVYATGTAGKRGNRYRLDPAAVTVYRTSSGNAEHVESMRYLQERGLL